MSHCREIVQLAAFNPYYMKIARSTSNFSRYQTIWEMGKFYVSRELGCGRMICKAFLSASGMCQLGGESILVYKIFFVYLLLEQLKLEFLQMYCEYHPCPCGSRGEYCYVPLARRKSLGIPSSINSSL